MLAHTCCKGIYDIELHLSIFFRVIHFRKQMLRNVNSLGKLALKNHMHAWRRCFTLKIMISLISFFFLGELETEKLGHELNLLSLDMNLLNHNEFLCLQNVDFHIEISIYLI